MTAKGTGKNRRRIRGAFRLCCRLLLIPLVTCTVLLFTTTGGSVPAAFWSWDDLGCVSAAVDWSPSTERFLCMSQCGRFYMTEVLSEDEQAAILHYVIYDWSNRKAILTLAPDAVLPYSLIVSKDRSLLAVGCYPGFGTAGFYIFQSSTGHLDRSFAQNIQCLQFSPDGKSVVFSLDGKIHFESLGPRAQIKTLELNKSRRVAGVFYDSTGSPKALVFQHDDKSAGAELWDVLSGERGWRAENIQGIWESFFTSPQLFMAWRENDADQAGHYSLENGRLHRTADLMNMECQMMSADSRFLAFRSVRPSILEMVVPASLGDKYYEQMDWLTRTFLVLREARRWSVMDVETGKTWPELKLGDSVSACFQADSSRIITFGSEGAYEWDLPPRQRWFTPWAWAALAATLLLGYCVWPRRGEKTRDAGANLSPMRHLDANSSKNG
jgi:hypothetical protein